jgi:hypothetical protein
MEITIVKEPNSLESELQARAEVQKKEKVR